VRTNGAAAAVSAHALDAPVLANLRASAVVTLAPRAAMLAHARATAVDAIAFLPIVRADARAATPFALAALAEVLAEVGSATRFAQALMRSCGGTRWGCTRCTGPCAGCAHKTASLHILHTASFALVLTPWLGPG
jgi:hypothetical protein